MPQLLMFFAWLAAAAPGGRAERLHAQRIPTVPVVSAAVIVGRARCGGRTWLLTETPQLVEIGDAGVAIHAVRGLATEAQPWGLACLSDGSLWTLEEAPFARPDRRRRPCPRTGRAHAASRRAVRCGSGARVRTAANRPRRAGSIDARRRRGLAETRPWIGLTARPGASPDEALMRSFVNCGLGQGGFAPCWFADESRVAIADGRRHDVAVPPPCRPTTTTRSGTWRSSGRIRCGCSSAASTVRRAGGPDGRLSDRRRKRRRTGPPRPAAGGATDSRRRPDRMPAAERRRHARGGQRTMTERPSSPLTFFWTVQRPSSDRRVRRGRRFSTFGVYPGSDGARRRLDDRRGPWPSR